MGEIKDYDIKAIAQWPRADAIAASDLDTLALLLKRHKISNDEYKKLLEIVGRLPTMAELGVFSAMWSEHCSYKSSKFHLRRLPTKGEAVVVGPGENAGVVRLAEKLCVAFKMESHNHPSYIEPYQGAATGVGGILRDVFCMGARPVANLNALRFGSRQHPRTAYLYSQVVKGIGDYGNCIGVPTVGGNVSFDETYNGNILVNAMTAGIIHEDRIFKGYASGPGNLVVYLGSATGRDGIHGATMASDSFASAQSEERSTVQVGDPFTEKLLLEATLAVLKEDLVVGLQDMGAAGLTSSSFEMADRAGSGLYIDLDAVPVRAQNMSAYELLLSESQERMLMVVTRENWPKLAQLLSRWELAYGVIGCVTTSKRMQISYHGTLEVDVPIAPLADAAPVYERPIGPFTPGPGEAAAAQDCQRLINEKGWQKCITDLIAEIGDKRAIYQQYDHHIGTKTVLHSGHDGAAVLWLRSDWAAGHPYLGLALATAANERYCAAEPQQGAAHGVLKCARMIAAAGGMPLAITDCLNYGNPERPEVMHEIAAGVDGIALACRELNTPVVSGNVSLYNETDGRSIAPTPMIGMVGRVDDVRRARAAILPMASREASLYLLLPTKPDFVLGPTRTARSLGLELGYGRPPAIDWAAEKQALAFLQSDKLSKICLACRDLGDGGIGIGVIKMCLPVGAGFTINAASLTRLIDVAGTPEKALLGELAGGYLIATQDVTALQDLAEGLDKLSLVPLGVASGNVNTFELGIASLPIKALADAWRG